MIREHANNISSDLLKFPDLQDYGRGLQALLSFDFTDYSYDQMSKTLYEKFILFQQIYGINPVGFFNQRVFYRARFNIAGIEDFNMLRTHTYPPASVCKENGRANLKGKSVFYCSETPGVAILESKPEIGQTGYLSIWEGHANRDVKYAICLHQNLRHDNPFRKMADDIHSCLNQDAIQNAHDKAQHLIELYGFIADRFIMDTSPYTLTSWLANEMLYESHPKDYIIYPSVCTKQQGCNLAFHPNSADTLLRFKKILKFELTNYDDANIVTKNHSIGELHGAHLKWRRPYQNELYEVMQGGNYC